LEDIFPLNDGDDSPLYLFPLHVTKEVSKKERERERERQRDRETERERERAEEE
jgi:hypothetical protein